MTAKRPAETGKKPVREKPVRDRRRAWQAGRWAESLAVWRLRCCGYRILARNWRSPVGEIDIIARRGPLLVIIEVKQRPDLALALEAISPRQRARLARAALAFQAHRPDCAGLSLRFDVIALGQDGARGEGMAKKWMSGLWPRHLKEAWRPGVE